MSRGFEPENISVNDGWGEYAASISTELKHILGNDEVIIEAGINLITEGYVERYVSFSCFFGAIFTIYERDYTGNDAPKRKALANMCWIDFLCRLNKDINDRILFIHQFQAMNFI